MVGLYFMVKIMCVFIIVEFYMDKIDFFLNLVLIKDLDKVRSWEFRGVGFSYYFILDL